MIQASQDPEVHRALMVVQVEQALEGVKERKVILSSQKAEDKKVIWVNEVLLDHLEKAATPEGMDRLASLDNQGHLGSLVLA